MYFFEKQIITTSSADSLIETFAQESDYSYADKFKRPIRQKQSLVGRCLIRKLATQCHPDTKPEDWYFQRHKDLGPTLHHNHRPVSPFISISHSQDMVISGLSPNNPIGVDIEYMGKERDILKIISVLTQSEDQQSLPQEKSQLYTLWVMYEAWYKLNPKKHGPPIPAFLIDWAKSSDTSCVFSSTKKTKTFKAQIEIETDYVICLFQQT